MLERIKLPIDHYLKQIVDEYHASEILLIQSSPGSGKTTRVPWEIAKNERKKVVVLLPRRLPTKMAATRVAFENNLILGQEVGYQFRFESKQTDQTKLLYITEGTFLRKLTNKNDMDEIGCVIIDEFHERHLETDFALGALIELKNRGAEFKIIIMSATLKIDHFFFNKPVKEIKLDLETYPVEIKYLQNTPSEINKPIKKLVRETLRNLKNIDGNILIFLPGMREMLEVKNDLEVEYDNIYLLHSEIEQKEQERCMEIGPSKIILSSSIAESSITIPNVSVVIDSGIQRSLVFSPWTGLSKLEDRKTSQSSSIQRSGRAGRTQAGICFRLFSEFDFNQRNYSSPPEIETDDLTEIYLLYHHLSLNFSWITQPNSERWKKAGEFLQKIGAINSKNEVLDLGKKLIQIPLHPRLGRCLIEISELEDSNQKEIMKQFVQIISQGPNKKIENQLFQYLLKTGKKAKEIEQVLLPGFIDQVGVFRAKQNQFIHCTGKILKTKNSIDLKDNQLVIIFNISKDEIVQDFFSIEESWLFDINPFPLEDKIQIELENYKFQKYSQIKLGQIILDEQRSKISWDEVKLINEYKVQNEVLESFKKKIKDLVESPKYARYIYANTTLDKNDEFNIKIDEDFLDSFFKLFEEANEENIEIFFHNQLSNSNHFQEINKLFPEQIKLINNKILKINYTKNQPPSLTCFIQDLYGISQTPTLLNGEIKINLIILGPHKRPIQITSDISNFWIKTYPSLKKELERNYPRHYWSESPERDKPILLKKNLI